MMPIDNTWGILKLSSNPCVVSCLGDGQVIFIDKTENSLFSVDASYKVSDLGYKYLFAGMTNSLYQLTYFPIRKEFQIYQYKFALEDAADIDAAVRMIEGTARSMGLEVTD